MREISERMDVRVLDYTGDDLAQVLEQVDFYRHSPGRFMMTVMLSFINWALGAVEVWIAFYLLGSPVTFAEAWIIEALVQLVRVIEPGPESVIQVMPFRVKQSAEMLGKPAIVAFRRHQVSAVPDLPEE